MTFSQPEHLIFSGRIGMAGAAFRAERCQDLSASIALDKTIHIRRRRHQTYISVFLP
jgi:hypothetical protein